MESKNQVKNEKVYRAARCKNVIEKAAVDALVLTSEPNIYYTTCFNAEQFERFYCSIVPKDFENTLIVPQLDFERAKDASWSTVRRYLRFPSPEPLELTVETLKGLGLDESRIGIEAGKVGLGLTYYNYLSRKLPKALFLDVTEELRYLRACKSEQEISLMKKSASIAEVALKLVRQSIRPGISELSIAAEVAKEIIALGGDPAPLYIMIQSGPRGASGHATLSKKKMNVGDLVVADIAFTYNGYFSDVTRTFVIGQPNEKQKGVARAVENALQAAKQAVRPGVPINQVNKVAHDVIVNYMGSQYIYRRTGHGIGLLVHEDPYVSPGDNTLLEKGMTFTLEPGIYISGWGGLRIEDDVAVTGTGVEVLNSMEAILIEV